MIKSILSWLIIVGSILGVMYLGWAGRMDYIFECFGRFTMGCNKWIDYGGWHFACVIIGWVIVLYAIGITWVAIRRKK